MGKEARNEKGGGMVKPKFDPGERARKGSLLQMRKRK